MLAGGLQVQKDAQNLKNKRQFLPKRNMLLYFSTDTLYNSVISDLICQLGCLIDIKICFSFLKWVRHGHLTPYLRQPVKFP